MEDVAIEEIRIDAERRLWVYPALAPDQNFGFIYRAAMDVSWDLEHRAFVTPAPREWSYLRCFEQIKAAVAREYGRRLRVAPGTRWSGVPDPVRLSIEQASAECAASQTESRG